MKSALLSIVIVLLFIVFAWALNDPSLSNSSVRGPTNDDLASMSHTRMLSLFMHKSQVTVGSQDKNLVKESVKVSTATTRVLPASADVWQSSIQVRDQGPWGSCTAFSTRYAYLINQAKNGQPLVEPSTSFWYAKSRAITPGFTTLSDTGSTLSATMNVLTNIGTIPETAWPYTGANIFVRPLIIPDPSSDINIMRKLTISNSASTNLTTIKTALADGHAVLIAILVFRSFMTTTVLTTGVVPLPQKSEQAIGGHAICLTGYNDATQTFTFYNSWGTYTGVNGRFTLPYAYASSPSYAGEYFSF